MARLRSAEQISRRYGTTGMNTVQNGPDSVRFIRETGLAGTFASLIEPVLEGLGFRLVRVIVSGRDGGTVQIMAERPDGTISIDDCAVISRNASPVIDAHDPMQGSYRLEISSPGIDRPIVRPSDFETWAGFEARIELKEPIDGRKRFRGRIEGYEDGEARIEMELPQEDGSLRPAVIGLPVGLIESAKLVLTDDLVQAALRRQSREEAAIADEAEARASARPRAEKKRGGGRKAPQQPSN
jgi:ribosome maturation factor RimP